MIFLKQPTLNLCVTTFDTLKEANRIILAQEVIKLNVCVVSLCEGEAYNCNL